MAEYIRREDAIKCIEGQCVDGKMWGNDESEGTLIEAYSAIDDLMEIPPADVAPVRHGRWIFGKDLPYSWGQIPKNKHHLYCCECLEQAFNRSEDNDPDFDVDTPYCPFCGCCMDEGADNG